MPLRNATSSLMLSGSLSSHTACFLPFQICETALASSSGLPKRSGNLRATKARAIHKLLLLHNGGSIIHSAARVAETRAITELRDRQAGMGAYVTNNVWVLAVQPNSYRTHGNRMLPDFRDNYT